MNTEYIMRALTFYAESGYTPAEVPILVDIDVSAVTKPDSAGDFGHGTKVYVGSAEQSFLQLIKDGTLPEGKLMALTPCMRDEPEVNDFSYVTFLKLELFAPGDCLNEVLTDAMSFFVGELGLDVSSAVKTKDGFDIFINGIEIGSYGVREYMGVTYTYGTGIAEPRLSKAVSYGL